MKSDIIRFDEFDRSSIELNLVSGNLANEKNNNYMAKLTGQIQDNLEQNGFEIKRKKSSMVRLVEKMKSRKSKFLQTLLEGE